MKHNCTICSKEFEQELMTSTEFKHGTVKFCPTCFESTVNLVSSGLEAYVEQMGKDIIQDCLAQVSLAGLLDNCEPEAEKINKRLKEHFRGPKEESNDNPIIEGI